MSSVYVNEPPTAGKVVLHTTFGDVDVELFSREAPLACRNFVQLCLERAYDDTLFHRVIPGFMVQTGDPTGTGTGGQSIWGKAFKDEFHSRLKFSHRGRVAMANSNTPNSNRQQFFITLDKATHCDSKYTIFGKVAGPTIFNVLRIGEVETDERDKPLEPVRIEGVDVIWNPFDDVVPRSSMEKLSAAEKAEQEEEKRRKERRKRRRKVKDNKLLSFGDEEAQERPSGAKGQSGGVKAQSDGAKEQAGGAREQAETSEAAAVERADKDQEAPARSMAPAPGSRPVPDEPERPTLALGEEQEEKQSAANAELEEARAEFRRLENKFLAKAVAPPSTKPGDRKKAEAAEKTIRPTLTLASSAGARSESERSKDVLLTEVEKRRRRCVGQTVLFAGQTVLFAVLAHRVY